MIHSPGFFARFALIVFCIVTLLPVSISAKISESDSGTQIHQSKQTKPKRNKKMSEPLSGEWSGKHITINFDASGAANVEFDCAHGAISQKVIPGKNNRFSAVGTYAEERGGPVRLDAQPQNVAVKFVGQITGKKMTLAIRNKEDGTLIGNFTLLRGQESLLVKCR